MSGQIEKEQKNHAETAAVNAKNCLNHSEGAKIVETNYQQKGPAETDAEAN
jgi:hypothetical protein